jgi:hypothetical protein
MRPSSTGVICSRSSNANEVVSELGVSPWDLILGHVTGDAILVGPRASCGKMADGRRRAFRRQVVATEAAIIVGARVARERLVRIVAGQAGYAGVPFLSPAAAEFKAVRLKANGSEPFGTAL